MGTTSTLPEFLSQLAAEGRNVEFVLMDGATRGDAVRRSVEALLNSDAVRGTVILIHGTMNEEIRREVGYIDFSSYSKIRYADLAFTQLYQAHIPLLGERWGGLGIILVDSDDTVDTRQGIVERPRRWRSQLREATWLTLAPLRRGKREVRHAGARVLRAR